MNVEELTREDAIYYARLSEQGERYHDMIMYMKKVAKVSIDDIRFSGSQIMRDLFRIDEQNYPCPMQIFPLRTHTLILNSIYAVLTRPD